MSTISIIQPEELADKIQSGSKVLLIDVRQPWENEYSRLEGSQLLPLSELADRLAEIEATGVESFVVYCHHGIRSLTGAAILQNAGFAPVFSLQGGIDAWSKRIDSRIPLY